jgi:ABC-type nitrate/sulfonate/bicarbonate transport system substrate-binding protein
MRGAEAGGVDAAVLPASSLAMSSVALRDAAPRAVMLLGRSRGLDVLGALPGITAPQQLAGKRLGMEPKSAGHYFALWVLSRAGLTLREVSLVPEESSAKAAEALKKGEIDAAAGISTEIGPAVKEKGGALVSTTADAPHLVAWVLAVRGEFLARYPDAMRRLVRGALDANAQAAKDPGPAALALGTLAPELGDPNDVLAAEPPAQLKDNLAFFGLGGETPVTYQELYTSAVALQAKVAGQPPPTDVDETADPSVLKYVSAAKP